MAKIPEYWGRRGSFGPTTVISFAVADSGTFSSGSESPVQRTVREPGTYSNLLAYIFVNTISAASTLRFRKNTANGNQSVSITASTTGTFEDTSNTDAVVAGDVIDTQLTPGGTGTQIRPSTIGLLFDATTNTSLRHAVATSFATASSTGYFKIQGPSQSAPTTESGAEKFKVKVAGTIKSLNVIVTSNGRASSATTYGTRLNGANGALSVSVSASATGTFEDSTNTDTVAVDDLINRYVTTGAGTGTITANVFTAFETTDGSAQMSTSYNAQTINTSVTWFTQPTGDATNAATTETDSTVKLGIACTLSKFECYVSTNNISATSTLRPRKSSANGSSLVSITASTTGWFEDASNTDTFAATDPFDIQIVTGGAGTSLALDYIGYKLQTVSSGFTATSTQPLPLGGASTATVAVSAQSVGALPFGGSAQAGVAVVAQSAGPLPLGGAAQAAVAIAAQSAVPLPLGGLAQSVVALLLQSLQALPLGGTIETSSVSGLTSTQPLPLGGSASAGVAVLVFTVQPLPLGGAASATTDARLTSVLALPLGGAANAVVAILVTSSRPLPLGGSIVVRMNLTATVLDAPYGIEIETVETGLDFDTVETSLIFVNSSGELLMGPFKVRAGERVPIVLTLTSKGVPADLTNHNPGTLKLMVRRRGHAPIIDDVALTPIVPLTSGRASYTPAVGELDVKGRYEVEVTGDFADGTTRKFPGEGEVAELIIGGTLFDVGP